MIENCNSKTVYKLSRIIHLTSIVVEVMAMNDENVLKDFVVKCYA